MQTSAQVAIKLSGKRIVNWAQTGIPQMNRRLAANQFQWKQSA